MSIAAFALRLLRLSPFRVIPGLLAVLAAHSPLAALVELTDVVQIEGGPPICALTGGGAVKCTLRGSHASDVPGLGNNVTAIGVSRGLVGTAPHVCAVLVDGRVKCLGNNGYGQLGDGTTTSSETPVEVAGLTGAVAVALGQYHTCALLATGGVKCWGLNERGQLGDGTVTQRLTPVDVVGLASGVAALSAAAWHTCAVTSAGGAKCWGANHSGNLGDGTTTDRLAPVDVSSLSSGVASISAGGTWVHPAFGGRTAYTCAVTTAGGAKCWGEGGTGALGDGTQEDHLTPFDVLGLTSGVAHIYANGFNPSSYPYSSSFVSRAHTCAVTTGGQAKCWGMDACGTLGHTHANCAWYHIHSAPQDVVGITGTLVASAYNCFLKSDGRVTCYGYDGPLPLMTGTAPQTITVQYQPASLGIGQSSYVSATASSGLKVVFSSQTPTICSVGAEISGLSAVGVNGLASGMCVIAMNQPGDGAFEPAPQVTLDFRIGDPRQQTITFGPPPEMVVSGNGFVSATASSGLPVTFASNTPSICSVSGNVVTGLAVGSCTVAARQNGDELYAAVEATQTFPVGPFTGSFVLHVTKGGPGAGTVTSNPVGIDCGSTCDAAFAPGASVTLEAVASAGSEFIGWTGACSGMGACTVTMSGARSVKASFVLESPIPRLAGISTRARVLTGDNVVIGGFIIEGTAPKTVVVRARGPSLGVAGALTDPVLTLVPGLGAPITNDDWATAGNAAQLSTLGYAPAHPSESAILVTLGPGAYTASVSGASGATGLAIIEVYEIDSPAIPLIGISTRAQVQSGDAVMIGGFIIEGDSPQAVVVRARGPSLGVAGALTDPILTLVPASGPPITNDDWQSDTNAAQLSAIGYAPADPKESALLVTLAPGAYTVVVSGVGGTTGVAIVEVYEAP